MTDSTGLTDKQLWAVRRRRHVKLTPEQAKALRPGTIRVNRHLWMEVRGARRDKKAGWYVDYVICDHRPRFMKRGTGYTHTVELAVAREDEDVVPEEYQLQLTMAAHRKAAERTDEEAVRRQAKSIAESVKQTVATGARLGVDMTPYLAQVQRVLGEAQAKFDKAA